MIQQGWKLEAKNWRAPGVEVDLVVSSPSRILIVEVKYRRSANAGGGFEAIGLNKIAKLRRAAHFWLEIDTSDRPISLVAADVDSDYNVEYLEIN